VVLFWIYINLVSVCFCVLRLPFLHVERASENHDLLPALFYRITAKDAYEVLARSTGFQLKKGRTCKVRSCDTNIKVFQSNHNHNRLFVRHSHKSRSFKSSHKPQRMNFSFPAADDSVPITRPSNNRTLLRDTQPPSCGRCVLRL
jgi:hypothetical protein